MPAKHLQKYPRPPSTLKKWWLTGALWTFGVEHCRMTEQGSSPSVSLVSRSLIVFQQRSVIGLKSMDNLGKQLTKMRRQNQEKRRCNYILKSGQRKKTNIRNSKRKNSKLLASSAVVRAANWKNSVPTTTSRVQLSCYLIYALPRLKRQLPTASSKRFTLRVTAEQNGAAVKYEKTKLKSRIDSSSKTRSTNLRMFSFILYFWHMCLLNISDMLRVYGQPLA